MAKRAYACTFPWGRSCEDGREMDLDGSAGGYCLAGSGLGDTAGQRGGQSLADDASAGPEHARVRGPTGDPVAGRTADLAAGRKPCRGVGAGLQLVATLFIAPETVHQGVVGRRSYSRLPAR